MEIKAKKSLGQNFLKDDAVLQRIIESANLSKSDVVIEIGPGQGVLTEKLAKVCKKVIAIELDDRLIPILTEKFKNNGKIEIVHDDILKINLVDLISNFQFPISNKIIISNDTILKNNPDINYKVIANLPYYITSSIIRLFLETKYPPQEMILMVQKEVAERICAQAGKMSILAVSVQYYAKSEYLFTVPKESFEPMPKVESSVIKITRNNNQETKNKQEIKDFFKVVRVGFSAKRKTLINNLSNGLSIDKKEIEEKLNTIVFSPPKTDQPRAGKNTRAQELGVEDWRRLVKQII